MWLPLTKPYLPAVELAVCGSPKLHGMVVRKCLEYTKAWKPQKKKQDGAMESHLLSL